MCGIAGFFGSSSSGAKVRAMCDLMAHRGPDDSGFFDGPDYSIGQRRLSINDLSGGRQPLFDPSGKIALVCNGEIYNYPELRARYESKGYQFKTRSDSEIVIPLYLEHGDDCVRHLRGMFGFALWDSSRRRLLLARDHLGQKPVFYASGADGSFAFASEPKAVLSSGLLPREVDMEALWHYMSLRYLPDDRSLFKGVVKLPAATYAVWEPGKGVRTQKYWSLSTFEPKRRGSAQELADELEALLLDTVKLHLLSDVPVATFLSGGIDSSLVTAMTAKLTGKPFDAFSIGVKDQDLSELPWAEVVAKQYGLNWISEIAEPDVVGTIPEMIHHMDEPADPFGVGVYLVSRLAAKHDKVVLSGDGGDENFAGYDRFAGQKLARLYGLIPGFLRRGVLGPAIGLVPESFGYKSLAGKLRWLNDVGGHARSDGEAYARSMSVLRFTQEEKEALFTDEAKSRIADSDSVGKILGFFNSDAASEHLDKMLYTDLMTRMPDQLLAISDRMSMAHSIEIRPPLIDVKVTEFAASLPCGLKLKGRDRGLKWLLRQVAARYLPRELIDRKKQGFGFPIAKWLRGDLASFQKRLFAQSRFVELGLFRQSAIDRLVDEHIGGKADHNFRLWMLINLEIWHRQCIEGHSVGEMKEFISSLRS